MITERFSKILLWLGVVLFIVGIAFFIWRENIFDFSETINSAKFGQLGDLFGGVIGSIWSLAGVILFYIALNEQRKDIKINQRALTLQVESLNQQIEEFKLQRQELEQTREVFIEQSETLKIQRFENTFFQLLTLFHEIIDKLTYKPSFGLDVVRGVAETSQKREVLSRAVDDLKSALNSSSKNYTSKTSKKPIDRSFEEIEVIMRSGYEFFYFKEYKQLLSHYYRNIYHIFKFIYTTDLIKKEKKQFYASLVRAQLSSDELFLIFYNSMIDGLGFPKFLFLVKEFDIMQNFDFGLLNKNERHKELFQLLIDNSKFEL